jgi:hypothetical protein
MNACRFEKQQNDLFTAVFVDFKSAGHEGWNAQFQHSSRTNMPFHQHLYFSRLQRDI